LLKSKYLKIVEDAGFRVESLSSDRGISKRQYGGFPVESLKIVAHK
jgi:arsenite methyltransferase